VIEEVQKTHLSFRRTIKDFSAQLYSEFKQFFPENCRLNIFVSYYDYYQPEAYYPSSGMVYIEKKICRLIGKILKSCG